MLEAVRRPAHRSGRQVKLTEAVLHHLLLPQVVQVIEMTKETITKEDIKTGEALETQMTTRGDQGHRRARTPRLASIPLVGRRQTLKKANLNGEDSGTSSSG